MNQPEAPSRGRLLFADDDPTARAGLAELLRRSGFDCVCVDSGQEAMAQLAGARFDALISDIHMPGDAGSS